MSLFRFGALNNLFASLIDLIWHADNIDDIAVILESPNESLAEELRLPFRFGRTNYLLASLINRVWNVHNRIDEIVEYIESSDFEALFLNEPHVDEKLGRGISHAIVSNSRISNICIGSPAVAIRDSIDVG
jgi:hypothetical protein